MFKNFEWCQPDLPLIELFRVPAQILAEEEGQTTPFEQDELVHLKPADQGFRGRLSAAADFGMSLTKANDYIFSTSVGWSF